MATSEFVGVALGAVGLGIVHGVEPGHGWPVAATYALDRTNKWVAGFVASLLLGVGHLISSVAMVLAFFWAKSYFELAEIGWMNYVAGAMLVLLGLREARLFYRGEGHHHHHHGGADHTHGHSHHDDHDHGHGHDGHEHGHGLGDHPDGHGDHPHDEPLTLPGRGDASADRAHDGSRGHTHDHADDHEDETGGLRARLTAVLPFGGGHSQPSADQAADRGLWGIAAFAFALGFAHEEEFEIIALCAGSAFCLELMLIYALAVIVAIVGFTLLLIAGYQHYEERVERLAPYLPAFSAAVLILMGIGFLVGVF